MNTEYRLDIHTAAGIKIAEITDFWHLGYVRKVNAPGVLTFTLDGQHRILPELEHNAQVIVYRRNTALGLCWTADFYGLYRGQQRTYTDHDVFSAVCPGILTMLSWRIVAWRAGVTNRSTFQSVKAETAMKALVAYNAASSATEANGRLRSGAITGISVQADGGNGGAVSIGCSYANLLDTLQKIAGIGGGDFDLVKTGAQAWEFRWYTGQLGTDRTDDVLFALERGNMADPVYGYDRVEERTVAIAAGQGEGDDRVIVVQTGPDYAAGNDNEIFVDARGSTTQAGVTYNADARLSADRAREEFSFHVIQTTACAYGVHYRLGDLVQAQYGSVNVAQKVVSVAVKLGADGGEQIDVETESL